MFYAKSTGGFYDPAIHGDAIPVDAVEITAEEYAALLAAQSAGKKIVADAGGRPIAVDPPAPSEAIVRAGLLMQIDHAADAARLAVAGDPLRAVEYQAAEAQATAFKAAGYAGTCPPAVKSWADAKGWTSQQAADDIIAVAAAWNGALLAIRDVRLKAKEGVRNAADIAAATAIASGAVTSITSLVAGV